MDAVYQLFISSSTAFNKPLKIFRKAVELCRGNAYNNNMEKEVQNRITADIAAFRLPRYAQIPEVGLYLEQVVRYINARLAPLGEPELTGSMVSNYVKQKLVPAPQKKLYTAEHLARLLFIAVVKPVVPLEGLRLMFSIQEECYPLQTAYDCAARSRLPSTRSVWTGIWRSIESGGSRLRLLRKKKSPCYSRNAVWQLQAVKQRETIQK